MSSCSRHENEEAVGICVNCGDLVCAACHKEVDGKGYCTVCADKLFASTEVKSEQTPSPVPAAARPAPLRAKKAKIEAVPVVQAAKAVEPVTLSAKAASEPGKPTIVQPGVKQSVSNLWWLLPLLFTWIGGVIAGLLTKDREPKKAINMFLTGLGMTFVHGIVIIALLAGSVQIPVVKLKSVAPTELNIPANSTWTATATAENGTTIQNAGISLEVPPGAVKSDTEIVVKEFAELPPEFYYAESDEPPPMALAMGNVYDVGPAGIQFDKPVQVTINYDKTLLPNGAKPENIKVGYWDGKKWIVESGYVDGQKGTVTISATSFPGSLVVPLVVGGAIIITVAYKISKLLSPDPRNQGTAPKHIIPGNDTVKSFTGKAGVGPNAKQWVPLVDPQRPGKLNPQILSGSGYKRIGFMEKGDKAATWVEYQEMVDGSDVNWTPPDAFLTNKGKGGQPKGDCTSVTNTVVSMLRGLGVEAYGVDGMANPNGKWREHAWVEFVYEGKPYYYDNDNGVVPLEDMKGKISVPAYTFNRGYMWNEKGQKSYQEGWWKGKSSNAPQVTIESPGRGGYINKSCEFVAKPDNIPAGARIEWYISGAPGESAAVYRDNETISHEFKSEGEKAVKVQYMQGNTIVVSDSIIFVIQGSSSLDVELPPPSSTVGKPLDPDKPNTFTAIPKNVPPDAVYTWYISGTKMDEGKDKTTLTVPAKSLQPVAEYEVSVIANWTGEDRKNKWLKASKAFFVETKSLYIVSDLPKKQAGKVCTEYTFTAKYSDMQPGTIFEWTVDGEQAGGGTDSISRKFKNHGSSLVTVKTTWQSEVNPKSNEAKYDVQIAEPKIVLKGPKELGPGEKGTLNEYYTFSIEPENIPDGATFKMGGIAITGTEEQFKMLDTGKQTVTAEARWDIDGCSGKVSDKREFEVGEPILDQITAIPATGTAGQQTTFKASGKYIPKSASIQWDLGKDGGSRNTSSIDEEVKHTYATAGSYPVTVTVRGPGQAFYGVKVLFYSVDAKPSLTLSMPPAGTANEKYTFTVDPTGIPLGAVYTWNINGTQVIEGNDKTTLTTLANYFKTGTTYKFYVVATWIDKTTPGVARANATFELPAAVVKIIGPGATVNINEEYTFVAESSPMPEGARIEWYFEGGKKYRDTDTVKHTFTTVGDKTVMVQWVIGNEVVPVCKDQIQFTVVAAPTLSIKMPGDGKVLQPDKENIFYAVSTSIPGDAVYEWYINEEGVLKAQGREGTVATAPAGFFKEGDYEILVIAKWKGADLKEQWAQADAKFKVAKLNISLSIIPPPEIQSKTAKENTKYYFAFNTNIPSTATFTWYNDGQEAGKGESIGLAFSSGQHIVELKANWQDSDAAKTKHEQKADPLRFNIAVTHPPDDSGTGWHLVKIEPPQEFSEYYGPHNSQSFENGKYAVTYPSHFNSDGPDQWQTNNFVYTKMPQYLKPDSDFKISCSTNTISRLGFSSDNIIKSTVSPGTDKVYYYGGKITNRCECEGSKTSTLHIMPGVPGGDKLRIRVFFISEDKIDLNGEFTGSATYIYEYR